MSADVRELLPLYALGILEPDEVTTVERAISGDPVLATELAAYQRTAEAIVTPLVPPPNVKARLLASVGQGRFETFSERMGKLFDVTLERAREFLGLIERPASWEPQPVPGIFLVHFDGGPAYAAADCGFIRLAPGAIFPPHKHLGEEVTIILSGKVRDAVNNRVIGPGEEYVQPVGSEHYLINEGPEDCIFAARAMNGIEVAGAPARPTRR
jgi:mannose-6-phosphate isomerase-like protein (cupin superfamily)